MIPIFTAKKIDKQILTIDQEYNADEWKTNLNILTLKLCYCIELVIAPDFIIG